MNWRPGTRRAAEDTMPSANPVAHPRAFESHLPASKAAPADPSERLHDAFARVRGETERRAAPLSPEDQVIQSMADASPTKWHRAHVTWFFEQFLLRAFAPAYRV